MKHHQAAVIFSAVIFLFVVPHFQTWTLCFVGILRSIVFHTYVPSPPTSFLSAACYYHGSLLLTCTWEVHREVGFWRRGCNLTCITWGVSQSILNLQLEVTRFNMAWDKPNALDVWIWWVTDRVLPTLVIWFRGMVADRISIGLHVSFLVYYKKINRIELVF